MKSMKYQVGLLSEAYPVGPAPIEVPADFPAEGCYRLDPSRPHANAADAANAHLLAAFGKLNEPFVPIRVPVGHDEPRLATLPSIVKVEVEMGKTLFQGRVWGGTLSCVESITARTSDGRVFSSPVYMAVPPNAPPGSYELCVTSGAREHEDYESIWYHLGGFWDEGDTEDTQREQLAAELDRFWAGVDGPDEPLRRAIVGALNDAPPDWESVNVSSDGVVAIRFKDGTQRAMRPVQRNVPCGHHAPV